MRFLEYDPALSLDKARTDSGQILVGAWFSGESSTGAHIRFPSVFRTQPNWNEPAIAIDMYAPKERAYGLFREILGDWPLMIANYSSTSWALRTIAEMTADFPAFMLVHGTTYLASSVATPTLISGFEQRFGKESVEYLPSGFVLKGEGLRGLSDSAREAYVFLREQMQQIASRIIAGS